MGQRNIAERQRIDLTVFADASFHSETGAAGWGAWIKGNGMERGATQGGGIRVEVRGAIEAEVIALVNAMAFAAARDHMTAGMTVLVQSDCLAALESLRLVLDARDHPIAGGHSVNRAKQLCKQLEGSSALDFVQALVSRLDVAVLVRHVRGHSKGPGRNWVNRHCDQLAKRGMADRRARILAARGDGTRAQPPATPQRRRAGRAPGGPATRDG